MDARVPIGGIAEATRALAATLESVPATDPSSAVFLLGSASGGSSQRVAARALASALAKWSPRRLLLVVPIGCGELSGGVRAVLDERPSMQVTILEVGELYGSGTGHVFGAMKALVSSGLPIPFGALEDQKRSVCSVRNLARVVEGWLAHPEPPTRLTLTDGHDWTLPELAVAIGRAIRKRVDVARVPRPMLEAVAPLVLGQGPANDLLEPKVAVGDAAEHLGVELGDPRRELEEVAAEFAEGAFWMSAPWVRAADVGIASVGLACAAPVMVGIAALGFLDTGSPIFTQERVGRFQQPFTLVKFRTMSLDTRSMATNLVSPASVTPLGRLLRKTKLDELPQLWNVLRGDMSVVGPRPGLFNQQELLEQRARRGVFDVRPGITGRAQVLGVDMSTPEALSEVDAEMVRSFRVRDYARLVAETLMGRGMGDRVQPQSGGPKS